MSIKSEWGSEAVFSPFKSNARGVAILFNNTFDFKIKKTELDREGNFAIAHIETMEKFITITNIYGPNRDFPNFYSNIKTRMEQYNDTSHIMCGDFNLVLDPTKDYENYSNVNNQNSRKEVLSLISSLNLEDIWRSIHPDGKGFTWRKRNPRKQARLDFFLVAQSMNAYVMNSKIIPGYRTDHSAITLEVCFRQSERGKGYWKFNSSLLRDINYVNIVKKCIAETITTYKNPHCNIQDNINTNEPPFCIDDNLFFETLLMNIRGKTISYSCYRKKLISGSEIELENKINRIEQEIQSNFLNISLTAISNLDESKRELENIRNDRLKGNMIRSRAKQIEYDEKTTKYFLHLEKQNFTNKQMTKLVNDDNVVVTDPKKVADMQRHFYEKLYSN